MELVDYWMGGSRKAGAAADKNLDGARVRQLSLILFFYEDRIYPPSQKNMGVSPWTNATVGPSEVRRAKEGASADSAEERKDTTGVNPWRLH